MKRLIALILAMLMLLNLTACGGNTSSTNSTPENKQQTENEQIESDNNTQTNQEESSNKEETTTVESSGYNFKGYTETADWPGADMWERYGLPNLVLNEDVSGTVHISDKDWIYPLNGSDGIMVEVRTKERHLDELMEILNNSGISLEETEGYISNGYSYYYQNNSTKMKIQLGESQIDVNDYKIQITIITDPTD